MVEIGKRDIVDRNSLAMDPFDRNCSFRAVDFSYNKHITVEFSAKFVLSIPPPIAVTDINLGYFARYLTWWKAVTSRPSAQS